MTESVTNSSFDTNTINEGSTLPVTVPKDQEQLFENTLCSDSTTNYITEAVSNESTSLPSDLSEAEYEQTLDYANLSSRVYDNLWDKAWDCLTSTFAPNLDFIGNTQNYTLEKQYGGWDGFDAQLYKNEETGKYVLTFSGTEAISPVDWTNNFMQILSDYSNIDSSQYQKAYDLALDLKNQYGNNLEFTGHSLGGGLAQVAALATGLPATCFCAAGLTEGTLNSLGISEDQINQNEKNIQHFNVQYDPLSDLDGNMNNESPFSNTKQYGDETYWLDNLPFTGGTYNPTRLINHFYHTIVYQMNNRNWV